MNERSDIEFPIWRKKVDQSFLFENVTPIPKWLWPVWDIENTFSDVHSKSNPRSVVSITFKGIKYKGHIFFSERTSGRMCRFAFEQTLHAQLKDTFLMSYMRALEGQIRKQDGEKADIELTIPFWEFIDIEFNSEKKEFTFTCHYKQLPTFPKLFEKLVSSPAIKKVDDLLACKGTDRIHKQDWKPRAEYKNEVGAENVIYTLLDTQKKLIYVGEAKNLINRFDNGHPDISQWDFYRYNVLPASLEAHRLTLERMAIRDMAALLKNKVDITSFGISEYKLVNRKIDK
ncbi:GIY-YIG nuclease family protein [Pseudidiomarina salilacus]|uniref:GIY-YIG nuclease family protein n=1 Tax=Pseudidiomarina salilacus TaxID=3384452 RepID=UPI0039855AC8